MAGAPSGDGRDFDLEFLAKLALAIEQGEQTVATLLTRQCTACQEWITELGREPQEIPSERQFERLVLEFRLSQLRAMITWLRTCERTLASHHDDA